MQYLVVGFAIMLFCLLLLSFAKYLLFDLAYVISALVVTLMVLALAGAIFSNRKCEIIVGLLLFMLIFTRFYSCNSIRFYLTL